MDWVIGIVLILMGSFIIFANYSCVFANAQNRKKGIDRHHSLAPVVGPVLVIVGLANSPIEYQPWFWLVWAIDPGTFITIYSLPFLVKEFIASKK